MIAKRSELTWQSKQVFITCGNQRDGTKFDIIVDIPSRRTYKLSQFLHHYLTAFFGEHMGQWYTLLCHEPRDATITFHDEKGKELATLFRLGHGDINE